jgi:hypothetical protein
MTAMTSMTHTPHLGRVALTLAATGVLALAGCSSSPEPPDVVADTTPPPSTSAPATPSTTPSATPTVTPTEDLEAQLLAATNNFYATIGEAYRTLDTGPVEKLLTPASSAAGGYTRYITEADSKGHHFSVTPIYKISNFVVAEKSLADDTHEAVFNLSASGLTEVDGNNQVVTRLKPESARARIIFVKRGNQWLVEQQDIL